MSNAKIIGNFGELCAKKYLLSLRYKIIQSNYHCRVGEIDLIAFDPKERDVVFVEVKTRISLEFGLPEESISLEKRNKIIKSGFNFLQKFYPRILSWRIDLIAIQLDRKMKIKLIKHLKNIFDG